MVVIQDMAKQTFIINALKQVHWDLKGIWIGGSDRNREGEWKWVTGERIGWSFWRSGQGPSQSGFLFVRGTWEDCAQIRLHDGYKWHDYPCDGLLSHYSYICEYNMTQPTAPTTKNTITITTSISNSTLAVPTTTAISTTSRNVPTMTAHMSTIASKSTTRILPTTTTTTHAQTTITHVLTTISKYTTRILPTVNTLGQTASDCPTGVQQLGPLHVYSDTCLVLVRATLSWKDARTSCMKTGGDLVMIKDADKQAFILKALSADHWNQDQVWIGATDLQHEGDWRWVDGTKVSFNQFADGQGNNPSHGFLFADADVEDCAVLRREAGGRWYDYHCEPSNPMEYHYPYICEFPTKSITTQLPTNRRTILPTTSQAMIKTSPLTTDMNPAKAYVIPITSKVGHKVTLVCPVMQLGNSSIIWYGPPNGNTLIANGTLVNPRLSSIAIVGNHTIGEYNLQLYSLTTFDAGVYRCDMIHKGSERFQGFRLMFSN